MNDDLFKPEDETNEERARRIAQRRSSVPTPKTERKADEDMMEKLEKLYEQREQRQIEHQQAVEALVPADVRAQLAALDSEMNAEMDVLNEQIKTEEEAIKAAVIETGKSVRGQSYQAVYGKGRISWDNKGLEKHLEAHDPTALERYRKQGAPSVSFRKLAHRNEEGAA